METKFIKYKPEQINLAELYRFSAGADISNTDVQEGTLIVGYFDNGKYPEMGYLRGMTRSDRTGEVLYEIVNAIEGQEYTTCIEKPYKVNSDRLPYVSVVTDSYETPLVGKIIKCNGELAFICDGDSNILVKVNTIRQLTICFKETK